MRDLAPVLIALTTSLLGGQLEGLGPGTWALLASIALALVCLTLSALLGVTLLARALLLGVIRLTRTLVRFFLRSERPRASKRE